MCEGGVFGCHCAFRTMKHEKITFALTKCILALTLFQTNGFWADACILNTWYYVWFHLGNDNDNEIYTNSKYVRVSFVICSFGQIGWEFSFPSIEDFSLNLDQFRNSKWQNIEFKAHFCLFFSKSNLPSWFWNTENSWHMCDVGRFSSSEYCLISCDIRICYKLEWCFFLVFIHRIGFFFFLIKCSEFASRHWVMCVQCD